MAGTRIKDQILGQKMSLVFFDLGNYKGFRSSMPGTSGRDHFVVQLLSHVQLFATSWTAVHQASLSFTLSWSLLTHIHWVGDAIQPSHPLSSPSPHVLDLSRHQGLFQCIVYYLTDSHTLPPFLMPKLKIYPLCGSIELTAFFTQLGLTIKIKHLAMYLLSSGRQKWTVIC